MAEGPVVCFEAKDVMEAIDLHRLRQISFWDAMIVHAARSAGAAVLYSEDLQHGAVLGGVRIENPFGGRKPRTSQRRFGIRRPKIAF
jgi:predicted nucleic acid-binding protein